MKILVKVINKPVSYTHLHISGHEEEVDQAAAGLEAYHQAVSYTHLDVYKRQIPDPPGRCLSSPKPQAAAWQTLPQE